MSDGRQQHASSGNKARDEGDKSAGKATRFPILLPVFDIANHDPAARVTWGGGENSSCEFTVMRDIPAGKEVWISYDDKSNEERTCMFYFSAP